MGDSGRQNIVLNLKIMESLKVQLLKAHAELFEGLFRGAEEQVLDALSGAVVILFSIANKVGISMRRLDAAVVEKLEQRVRNPRNSMRDCDEQILAFWRSKRGWEQ